MITILLIVILLLLVAAIVLQLRFYSHGSADPQTHQFAAKLEVIQQFQQRAEDLLRSEFQQNRSEAATFARDGRDEQSARLDALSNQLQQRMTEGSQLQQQSLHDFAGQLQALSKGLTEQSERFNAQFSKKFDDAREDASRSDSRLREEIAGSLKAFNDSVLQRLTEAATLQKGQLESFATSIRALQESMEGRLETVRSTVEGKLKQIQDDNTKQLDQMRATVEEKLQGTLDTRLGEAFKQVSERLDQVHKGLGEMQTLATGVGDLKRVLSNVKMRGGWGEVQLGSLLEQMLTPDQFERNVRTRTDSQELVEFAIKLPGKTGDTDEMVWLPVDSKFPIEDYQRLVAAQEIGDMAGSEEASKSLATSVTNCAKLISGKYLNPPRTTDFGIMFLPTEGLFAEIIRRPGLIEKLQNEHRVVVAGPTTFAALLNSLQMGFKTLTIQKQSSEVWKVLGSVRSEFSKFGGAIEAVKRKLEEASKKIDDVEVRARAVNRSLKNVDSQAQLDTTNPLISLVADSGGAPEEPE